MTLQDEEAVGSAETEASTAGAQAAAAPAAKADRIKAEYDTAGGTVTLIDGDERTVHSLVGIPDHVRQHLALIGLFRAVQQSRDVPTLMERMRGGGLPGRVAAEAKPKPIDDWRKAYAAAKVETTKKTDAPMTLEAATEAARALTREQLVQIKSHPVVVKHYAKITEASADLI